MRWDQSQLAFRRLEKTVADMESVELATAAETITGTSTTKAVSPAGLAASLPYVDVKSFGATGVGASDDAAAIRLAADSATNLGKGLFFSPGTYLLDSIDGNGNFVTLTEGLEIFGQPGASIIKVGTSVTTWNHVFGPAALQVSPNTDLSGLNVHDLIFDGNSAANPINVSNPTARRYIVGAYTGTDIRVHDNQIHDWDTRNLFLIDGRIDGITNIWVYNNRCSNFGGAYWHDASAVFASGVNVHVYGNQMVGASLGATTPSSAWSAYEVHGHAVYCHDNISENFFSPFLVVSLYTAQPGTTSKGYQFHNNIGLNAGCGFTLWPQVVGDPITDIHVHHNTFDINIDQWPTAAGANNYPGTPGAAGHYGLGLIVGNSYAERVRIEDNDFTWRTATLPNTNDHGIWWVHSSSQASSGPVDKSISISRNRFIGTPQGGIYVQWYYGLSDWDINDNTFFNIGKAAAGENLQAGLCILDTNSLTVSSHTQLEDIRFNRNKFIDDQVTHTLSYPLLLAAGTSSSKSCTFTNTSATVLCATVAATDIRANIESATGVLAAANRIITSIVAGVSFTMSGAATASVTENATFTGGNGITSNVEMLDTQMRIEDGTAIPLAKAQATGGVQHPSFTGQFPYIRSSTPAWASPVGPAKTGSEIVDHLTGLVRRQVAAPGGSTWQLATPLTIIYKTGDQSESAGTLTDVTDLTFPVDASGVYKASFHIFAIGATATVGLGVAVNGPTIGAGLLRYSLRSGISGTASNYGASNTYNTTIQTTDISTVNSLETRVDFYLRNGTTAGTVALRMRTETAATSVTIQEGSWMEVTRLG